MHTVIVFGALALIGVTGISVVLSKLISRKNKAADDGKNKNARKK